MIKEAFLKSWVNLKQNWKLLVPDLIYRVVIVFISFYFLDYFNVISAVINSESFGFEFLIPLISNALKVVIPLLLFEFLLSTAADSIRFGLINDLIKKNKCILSRGGNYVKSYYFSILKMKLVVGLIYVVAALLTFLVAVLFNFTVLKEYTKVIFFITAGLVYLFMSLSLVFKYPILIMENKKALNSVLLSYKFFRNNFNYTAKVGIIIGLLALMVPYLSNYLVSLTGIAQLSWLVVLINTILSVLLAVFAFNAYHLKKKP